jgi:hypothetical protein
LGNQRTELNAVFDFRAAKPDDHVTSLDARFVGRSSRRHVYHQRTLGVFELQSLGKSLVDVLRKQA